MQSKKRVVVKIGSSLLANAERLTPRWAFIQHLMEDVAALRRDGYEVVLCSSGAVALGLKVLGESAETAGLRDKQAAAACGMPLLINAYKTVASEHGVEIGQVLLTLQDMEERSRFINTKNTLHRLLNGGILPIVNENDSVTTEEIRVGDNDRLAAKVAQMVQAQHLVILTCIDGLYDRNPEEEGATLIEVVEDVGPYIAVTAGTSTLGTGGMLTKLQAANMAQNAGCVTHIAHGDHVAPVSSVLRGERRHTRCVAHSEPDSAWKAWLTDRLQIAGSVVIFDDVASGLKGDGQPILRQHIKSIQGPYVKGDVIHIYDESGAEIARGLSNFTAEETMVLARNAEMPARQLLGYHSNGTVISQENLVVLEDRHLLWESPNETRMVDVAA